MTSTNLF